VEEKLRFHVALINSQVVLRANKMPLNSVVWKTSDLRREERKELKMTLCVCVCVYGDIKFRIRLRRRRLEGRTRDGERGERERDLGTGE
jgi:hypothetical protein